MVVVTEATGLIGSCLISRLNENNFNYIIAVDSFCNSEKNKNMEGKKIQEKVNRDQFFPWLEKNQEFVEFIFHLEASNDRTEFNKEIFDKVNVNYFKTIWKACCDYQIPLVYASSPTTSQNQFDKWALEQEEKPFFWAGLKFPDVYGPNEFDKEKRASAIFQAFDEISQTGPMKSLKLHNLNFKEGELKREFVYVTDVVEVILLLMHHRKNSGIYNLGTG